jgi:hypothetical protein
MQWPAFPDNVHVITIVPMQWPVASTNSVHDIAIVSMQSPAVAHSD